MIVTLQNTLDLHLSHWVPIEVCRSKCNYETDTRSASFGCWLKSVSLHCVYTCSSRQFYEAIYSRDQYPSGLIVVALYGHILDQHL